MTSILPIPATSAYATNAPSRTGTSNINGRTTPDQDAARFLAILNGGDKEGAMQYLAGLMGVDDPDKIPPFNPNDSTTYIGAFMTHMGAEMQIRQWAMTGLPRMLEQIKVK